MKLFTSIVLTLEANGCLCLHLVVLKMHVGVRVLALKFVCLVGGVSAWVSLALEKFEPVAKPNGWKSPSRVEWTGLCSFL